MHARVQTELLYGEGLKSCKLREFMTTCATGFSKSGSLCLAQVHCEPPEQLIGLQCLDLSKVPTSACECMLICMLGVRMPQINKKLIMAIVIGVVLAFCVGLLLFLVRKNPRRAKKIMGEASVDHSESNWLLSSSGDVPVSFLCVEFLLSLKLGFDGLDFYTESAVHTDSLVATDRGFADPLILGLRAKPYSLSATCFSTKCSRGARKIR